ncbi:uncharacterized protein YfkK (UPF0435 family) [Pullulanibacillus pueri]|uniref:Uncharacterized protein n=1 Tax=Pullulanibacillus pueri TaxID=1437324 RepID=A0A8J3EKB2_9BACL|nr:DUF1128 domain-containing protein [Pullulanibacillus pueri]MBM7680201.1 uncharacterized protein YfkK (UPF0435 family) [Pullulanibacillus pueri]GGH74866.1 hypothetical protein GCM10007096_03500 [Pullulanibacillus pueri]
MDLTIKNEANIHFMIDEIKNKLQLVNRDVLKASAFSTERYEELHDIYKMVKRMPSFSIRDMEAILEELRALRTEE